MSWASRSLKATFFVAAAGSMAALKRTPPVKRATRRSPALRTILAAVVTAVAAPVMCPDGRRVGKPQEEGMMSTAGSFSSVRNHG